VLKSRLVIASDDQKTAAKSATIQPKLPGGRPVLVGNFRSVSLSVVSVVSVTAPWRRASEALSHQNRFNFNLRLKTSVLILNRRS